MMPIFPDTPMPTVYRTPDPAPPQDPGLADTFSAGFRMDNDVSNALELMTRPQFDRTDMNYNLKKRLQESPYWDFRDNFIGVRSDKEFDFIASQIEQEQRDRDVLARSGWTGVVASMTAGLVSPTLFMPFIGQARGVAAVGRAMLWGAAGATAQELPLIMNQQTRTGSEVAFSLATSTILSGLLGGAVGFMRPKEIASFDMAIRSGQTAIPQPVGAAGALAKDPGGIARGAATAARVLDTNTITRSPVTDNLAGISAQARWTTAQLADAGLSMERNALGIPTTPGGTAENAINRHWGRYAQAVEEGVDDVYNNYIFDGHAPVVAPRLRAGVAGYFDRTKLSRADFRKEVSKAMWDNDVHAIPEVAKAAKFVRQTLYDPILKEAQDVGLIPAELKEIADVSYLNRVYNHEAIRADVNGFVDFLQQKFNTKYQEQFSKQLEDFQLKEARTTELLDDLKRSPEEIQELRDRFGKEISDIETFMEADHMTALEDSVALLRSAARKIDGTTLEGARQRKQFLKDARDMEQGDPKFVGYKGRVKELKRRLSNLNKARVAVDQKLANKIEKIDRAEELSLNTLRRSTLAARRILDKMDEWSDEKLDAELSALKTKFARTAEIFDRGEERITKLTQDEAARVGPFTPDEPVTPDRILAAEALQQTRADRLTEFSERIADAEDLGRPAVRDLLSDMVDATLSRAQRIVEKRAVRTDRLKKALDDLSPEAYEARIKDIADAQLARQAKFGESVRIRGGVDEDIFSGKVDFSKQARADANAIKDKILGTYLRLPAIEVMQGERGAQLARMLDIPSRELERWLETDVDKLAKIYTRTMGPDIEIMRKLGTVNGEEQFGKMFEEMNEQLEAVKTATTKDGKPLSDKAKQKEVLRIQDEFAQYKKNLEGIIGRLRGTYGLPADFDGMGFRMAQTVMHLNVLRYMGGVTISSLPDVGRPVMRYGLLRTFRDGFLPLVTNLKAVKMSRREAKLAGVGIDALTAQRANSLFELMDDLGRGSKFERGVEYLSGKQGLIAIFSYWTDAMKSITSAIANAKVMDSVMTVVEGGSKGDMAEATRFLAEVGIDGELAQRIAEQVRKNAGGGKVDGVWLPQTENWNDDGAMRAFRAALAREVNNTIVTPGVERPLWTNASTAGRMLSQFKSFAFSSTYKTVLAGLQQRDTNFMQGVVISLAMGALSYYLYSVARGGDAYERMQNADAETWADEAIARSGVLGVLGLAQDITSRIPATAKISSFSGGRTTRRGGDDLVEAVLGPSFDFAKTSADVLTEVNDPTASTTHKMRQLLPWQNVSYLSWLFDATEKATNKQFNIPETRR